MKITWLGHATCVIEGDDEVVITDPLLRRSVWFLRRVTPLPELARMKRRVTVLLSHLHGDHYDPKSLRQLKLDRILVPRGGKNRLVKDGFDGVEELQRGDELSLNGITITGAKASHASRPWMGRKTESLSYVIESEGKRIWFGGDTALFPDMRKLAPIDVALMPIWGWGPLLGPGHLSPRSAAVACQMMQFKTAIPIHWGTYAPWSLEKVMRLSKWKPPVLFERQVEMMAKVTRVKRLDVGESCQL